MNTVKILKTTISETSLVEVSKILNNENSLKVAVCNTNTVVRSHGDKQLSKIINSFDIKTPDGFPIAKSSSVLYKNGQRRRMKGLRKSFNQAVPCASKYMFLDWLRKKTYNEAWEMDTWEIQPEKYGWTPWHSGKNKPINFVRFIWNSGVGITHYVDNKKHYKYKDSKYTGQKCWNCLVGKLDGRQYLADQNTGKHKRIVVQFSLPSKYDRAVDEFVSLIQTGNSPLVGTPVDNQNDRTAWL